MELTPEPLDPARFAEFGKVLRREDSGENFQVVFADEESAGWRVALLQVAPGPMGRLHRHPDSEECFAPLYGKAFMAVSLTPDPSDARLFCLEEPVCIRRGIWHEVVAAEPARVFIAENAQITGEARMIEPPVRIAQSC